MRCVRLEPFFAGTGYFSKCDPGKYASRTGMPACMPCAAGYFTPKSGSRCESPETSLKAGAGNCSACVEGYYLHSRFIAAPAVPRERVRGKYDPEDHQCPARVLSIYRVEQRSDHLPACEELQRYRRRQREQRAATAAIDRHRRDSRLHSRSLWSVMPVMRVWLSPLKRQKMYELRRCDAEYEGPRRICGNRFHFPGDFSCLNRSDREESCCSESLLQKAQKNRIEAVGARLTALIITMQIIILVNNNHKDLEGEGVPAPFRNFLENFNFLTLDIMSVLPLGCAFGHVTHFKKMVLWTIVPTAMIVAVSIAVCLVKRAATKRNIRKGTCYVIILMLPLISRTILQTFRCVKYNEDDKFTPVLKVLFVDQSVDCKKSSYALMKHYAILNVLIWPVGVPIGLMIWLSTVAKYLDPPNVSEEQAIQERNSNEHIKNSAIAFLALKYKPRYWYYEIIFSLTRRLVLTCVVLVFNTRGGFILFVLFVSILTTVCEREMDAFIDPYLGSFVYLMSWQTLLCMLAMLIMDAEMTSDVGDVSVGVTLLLLNVLMMIFVFVETKENVKRRNTERMAKRFEIEALKKAQPKTKPSGVRSLWEKVLGRVAAGDGKANRVMPVLSHEGKVDDDADFDGNSSDEFESKDDTMEMSNEKSGGKQKSVTVTRSFDQMLKGRTRRSEEMLLHWRWAPLTCRCSTRRTSSRISSIATTWSLMRKQSMSTVSCTLRTCTTRTSYQTMIWLNRLA